MSRPTTKQKLIRSIEAVTALRLALAAGRIARAEFDRLYPVLSAIADDYRAAFARQAA